MKPILLSLLLLAACGGKIAPSAAPQHCTVLRDELDPALLLRTQEVRCGDTTIVTTDDLFTTEDKLAVRQ